MPEVRDILGELYSMTILHPGRNAVAGANMRRSFAELSRSHCGGTGEHARLRKAEVQEAEELERRGNRSFRSGEVVRQVVRGRRRLECRSGVVRYGSSGGKEGGGRVYRSGSEGGWQVRTKPHSSSGGN